MQSCAPRPDLTSVDYTMPDGNKLKVTDFFGKNAEYTETPQANHCEFWRTDPSKAPEVLVPPHFHHVRQFLVFTDDGKPDLNDEHVDVPQFSFQFTDPSTPYGPVTVDAPYMAFFAMRSKPDVGGHSLDKSAHKLRGGPGRRIVVSPPAQEPAETGGIEVLLDGHADGLAGYRLVLGAGERAAGPDPSPGDGQYWVVMRGSVVHDGQELPKLSLLWVGPDEPAGTVTAGREGAALLIVQFPKPTEGTEITEAEWEAAQAS